MSLECLPQIAKPLLEWYDAHARVLPWRSQPSPYRVWISEIMLQQTRVEAAIPYFERFVGELPTVAALAAVDDERLLKLWEGLGYYHRARNLKKAACLLMERHQGRLPSSPEELEALPGIGHYTAGAIASIAYGARVPAVDGNVLRVASRLLASEEDLGKVRVRRLMEERVSAVLPGERVGDFNQSLMDLGATVCLPDGEPRCDVCPVRALCEGRRRGIASSLPVMPKKKNRRIEEKTVFVIVCGGRVAISRRPDKGLLPGLWELPSEEGHLAPAQCEKVMLDWKIPVKKIQALQNAKHIFSHIEWHMAGYLVCAARCDEDGRFVWAEAGDIFGKYALPSAFKAYTAGIPQFCLTKP